MRTLGVESQDCSEKTGLIERLRSDPSIEILVDQGVVRYEEAELKALDLGALRSLMRRHQITPPSVELGEQQAHVEGLRRCQAAGWFGVVDAPSCSDGDAMPHQRKRERSRRARRNYTMPKCPPAAEVSMVESATTHSQACRIDTGAGSASGVSPTISREGLAVRGYLSAADTPDTLCYEDNTLEDQQEPFVLNNALPEKGCTPEGQSDAIVLETGLVSSCEVTDELFGCKELLLMDSPKLPCAEELHLEMPTVIGRPCEDSVVSCFCKDRRWTILLKATLFTAIAQLCRMREALSLAFQHRFRNVVLLVGTP
jgi:hypothetical protein